ncbi:DUF3500 domain-containing protein [Paludisphaera sp.]|uniref:DUF3500 domain-containing protein n=1 Tax=Paludisphaera sp. TaxID=2017432 RepID=UPI00301CDB75
MKRPSLSLAILVLWASPALAQTPVVPRAEEKTGALMIDAARRFLGTLDADLRAKASFALDDPERQNWHWIPRPRKGVSIKEMTHYQRPLAFALLDTGLSGAGSVAAATTMSYEEIIRIQENESGRIRDPELYYVSVFGTPGEGRWGWRWEGHHLSLNYTLDGDEIVSVTPFMFGSNPAKVVSGPNEGLRSLAAIQDPIYKLLASLSPGQKEVAILSERVPKIPSSPNDAVAQPLPAGKDGLAYDDMTEEQRALLRAAGAAYLEMFPEAGREVLMDGLRRGEGRRTFAWYGTTDTTKPHAFRLQGPSILIDFNNEQDGGNHIHTFFRDLSEDFGSPAK